jgi:hypothetical protein
MKRRIEIVCGYGTLSYRADCHHCGKLVFLVTFEAIHRAPKRETGSSTLLPVHMAVPHDCPVINPPEGLR